MLVPEIVIRFYHRRLGLARRLAIHHRAILFSVTLALALAGASCGPAAPAPTRSLGASTASVPGSTQTSLLTVTPLPVASPQPSATVSVATRETPPPAGIPSATPNAVMPSLQTSMLADPRVVAANGVVTYVIVIMNDMLGGPDPGAPVMVTGNLPANTTYLGGTASGGATYDKTGRIMWRGG